MQVAIVGLGGAVGGYVRWDVHAPPGIFDPLRDRDPVQVGGYRLRARLGSGGMGEVFLSFDGSARPVAVKALRAEFADDRQFRARFAREVRAARQVQGPNIAPLLDADPDAEIPWLATAYVAGPTLADAVELYGPLPVSSVLVLMAGIAEALRAIHATGIVHRDLKPANVVLGADGLRVIDFGIARAADATPLTMTGMMVGSPQYVAPEQVVGEPPEPAGDVFSLGALAHYAATGRPAFGDGPRIAVLYRIVNEPPDLAGCPRQIRSLIEACLARDPGDRPTVAEIIEVCTPDEPPRAAADWLPEPVMFAIDAYRAALDSLDPLGDAPYGAEPDSAAATAAPETAQPGAPDGEDSNPTGAHHRLRRGAVGLAAALAVLAGGAVATVVIASGSGARPESAAVGGGTTPAVGQQSGQFGQSGIAQSGIAQSGAQNDRGAGGGPPAIAGLGTPLGPPPAGGAPPPGGGPPGGGGPDPPVPTTLWWSGTVRITSAGLWLDARPPLAAQGHGDIKEAAPAPTADLSSGVPQIGNIARWTGTGTPTGAQCRTVALAQGTSLLQHVGVGDFVCALTAYRQVAVLRIENFPTDDSGVTAAVTVWGTTRP